VIVTAAVAIAMILGLVTLQALLAQASFKIGDLQSRLDDLTVTYQQKSLLAAQLEAPLRIAREAERVGLGLPPGGIQVLYVPDGPPGHHTKAVVGVSP
jgi:hypothetical protein